MLEKWEKLTDIQLTLQKWMSGARGAVCDDIMDIAIAKEQQVWCSRYSYLRFILVTLQKERNS